MNADVRAPTALIRLRLRDLYDLSKPRLSLMVVLTTIVGSLAATGGTPNVMLLLNTALGTFLTAAGASALNQYIERRSDRLMLRTADRPLPSGRVAPRDVLALGAAGSAAGIVCLMLAVNLLTAALALATLLTYVAVYTPLKRVTPWCTLVGAVSGALPIVMGWTAVANQIDLAVLVFFGVLFAWQVPHFMAISLLYVDDYARADFPMWPVVDSRSRASRAARSTNHTGTQAVLWSILTLAMSLLPATQGSIGIVTTAFVLAAGAAYVIASIRMALTRSRTAARVLFLTSLAYLPLTLGALAISGGQSRP